ncbi:MAG: fimbrial protein [Stenotrophomonas maltophilia]|nr:MAG: fimbrial protein [Stenotrophomonas maltophilia]
MARINLLPWRAERRKQRQREFYAMLGMAAIGGLLLSLYGLAFKADIDDLRQEIDRLDAQKDRLLARKKVIEELQAKRSQMVHLFDALVRTIPDGLVLTALKQEGDVLTLEGRTQSNARVSAYMRNLETSGWMTNPELSIIEARDPEKDKDGKTGPVADIKALPYVFVVKVKLPAQSEEVAATPGLNADGSVATAAPAPVAPLAAGPDAATPAAPAAGPAANPAAPTPAAPAAAPASAPAAAPAKPNQPAAPAAQPAPKPEGSRLAQPPQAFNAPLQGDRA